MGSNVPKRAKKINLTDRYVGEMDSLDREFQEIIRRHPCKNSRCLCDKRLSIAVPSKQDVSSFCGILWNIVKTVAVNVTKLTMRDKLDTILDKYR